MCVHKQTHPGTTETAESVRVGVVSVVELDVVVAAVGLFLHLEGDEAELHAVALLGHQQPLAVRVSWVVVVPELGVRVEVALAHLGLQAAAAFCKERRREGGKEGRREGEGWFACLCPAWANYGPRAICRMLRSLILTAQLEGVALIIQDIAVFHPLFQSFKSHFSKELNIIWLQRHNICCSFLIYIEAHACNICHRIFITKKQNYSPIGQRQNESVSAPMRR